jgi:pyruvate dehydrogenase E2 component (dihydrolipoamide acetyltransferase)
MATTVQMPKLGNTVEECVLTAWRKHTGDAVAAGDIVAEVETDKASFEVPAPVAGTVLDTFVDEGAIVPVFTSICVIGAPDEVVDAASAPAQAAAGRAELGAPATQAAAGRAEPAAAARQVAAGAAEPAAGAVHAEAGYAQHERGAHPAGGPSASLPALSPRARRFAREHDFMPSELTGSGPGGRVTEADVRALFAAQPRLSEKAKAEAASAGMVPAEGSGIGGMIRAADLAEPAVPMSAVRQRIAARLRESLSSTAQYTLNSSANAGGLLAVRRALKDDPATADITINDLVVFCTIRALGQVPELNAELVGGMLRRHAAIHLGFACDTDRGLVVPVVRDSQRLSLADLARCMRHLAERAVHGTIGPDDLTGGTFTVSNLGSLGIESFTPVLNPPQVAILGIDAIGLKPVRNTDGNIEFIDSIGLSLTVDHQVIDGALGARFLAAVTHEIESARTLCMT